MIIERSKHVLLPPNGIGEIIRQTSCGGGHGRIHNGADLIGEVLFSSLRRNQPRGDLLRVSHSAGSACRGPCPVQVRTEDAMHTHLV